MTDNWESFRLATNPVPTIKMLKRQGMNKKEALAFRAWFEQGRTYLNNVYQVTIREHLPDGWPAMLWLSIKRIDKEPIKDWRDFQRIKNELVGPEHEAVELYPAESRLIDTSNQYHMYVLKQSEVRFPFGMNDGRCVTGPDAAAAFGAKQRKHFNRERAEK